MEDSERNTSTETIVTGSQIESMEASEPVPYTADGVVDWAQLETNLPEEVDDDIELEVIKVDFSKPQSSKLHSYFHNENDECCIVGHKCKCPVCTEASHCNAIATPSRRRKRQRRIPDPVATTEIHYASQKPFEARPAATACMPDTLQIEVPDTLYDMNLTHNMLTGIHQMARHAPVPEPKVAEKKATIPPTKKRYTSKTAVHDETLEAQAVTAKKKI